MKIGQTPGLLNNYLRTLPKPEDPVVEEQNFFTRQGRYMNSLFDPGVGTFNEPKMALQEVPNEIRGIAENAAAMFSKEHFTGAEAVISMKWGDYNKPWVFTDEGVEDSLLKKEKLRAEQNIKWVPEERIKKFNITQKIMGIINKFEQKFEPVDLNTRSLKEGITLPGKYKVIFFQQVLEEWTSNTSSYSGYLVYNEVFKKLISIKAPRVGQYRNTKDFLVMIAQWKKISDHPNIHTIHYIELLNDTPQLALEYLTAGTIERIL